MSPSVLSLSPHKTYNETGKILNDRLGQFIGKEHHVYPWLIHVNVWQKKPPQYCIVISLQLK